MQVTSNQVTTSSANQILIFKWMNLICPYYAYESTHRNMQNEKSHQYIIIFSNILFIHMQVNVLDVYLMKHHETRKILEKQL